MLNNLPSRPSTAEVRATVARQLQSIAWWSNRTPEQDVRAHCALRMAEQEQARQEILARFAERATDMQAPENPANWWEF